MLKPIFYANDDGMGRYTGLVKISQDEYDNTLVGMMERQEDPSNFESRVIWLWTNHNPPPKIERQWENEIS